MEHKIKRSLLNYFHEDEKSAQQQIRLPHQQLISHNLDSIQRSPSTSMVSPSHQNIMHSMMPPPSPDSPWTLSPLQSPSAPLLCHCIASLHRLDGTVHAIAAINGTVFTGSDSSRIRAWRQPDCFERGYLKASSGSVRAILAYGNVLFTTHKDFKIRTWIVTVSDNFKAKKISTLPRKNSLFMFPRRSSDGHKDFISCMAYYNSEGLLYTGSWDRTVKVWRVWDSLCVDTFLAHDDNVNGVVVNQEDGVVFTCSCDGSIKIWRRIYGQSSHTLTMTLRSQSSPINAMALSTSVVDSYVLYSGSSDGFINFWEKEKVSGRYNHGGVLQGHRFSVLCLVALGKLIFSGSEDTTIRIWRREEGKCSHECLAVVDAHRGPVKCLAASLEIDKEVGVLLYSAGLDQNFKVWRVKVTVEERSGSGQFLDSASNMKLREFEISPVLSPSWVERKLHGSHPSR
ncbi:Myosin heavy chain kinase B [Heracleum sosnowskyi]|uniref:Myosin heavy chain kinase B n=1 Tax=Heracleum sosnowskyi TaxID=360622 RepID=A0AAD8HK67_9APIA|nr:Myosin heavy chain kinase B [Heracleum sosnowskyi]